MIRVRLVLVATLAVGCVDKPGPEPAAVDTALEDWDGDGVGAEEDCDDADPGVYPGATEVCDGADQDCDAWVDEGLPVLRWYTDEDGDGYAGTAAGEGCGPPVAVQRRGRRTAMTATYGCTRRLLRCATASTTTATGCAT